MFSFSLKFQLECLTIQTKRVSNAMDDLNKSLFALDNNDDFADVVAVNDVVNDVVAVNDVVVVVVVNELVNDVVAVNELVVNELVNDVVAVNDVVNDVVAVNDVVNDAIDLEYSSLSVDITSNLSRSMKKKDGIFFTPPKTIHYILNNYLKQFISTNDDVIDVLEPSFGSGEWIKQMMSLSNKIHITGVEYNNTVFNQTVPDFDSNRVTLFNDDFLKFNSDKRYDFIVGNPPYKIKNKTEVCSSFYEFFDYAPNMYLLFILKCLKLLKPDGTLSFVVPHPFLSNTSFYKTRKWIYNNFNIINIEFIDDKYIETEMKTVLIIFKKPVHAVNININNDFAFECNASIVFGCKYEITQMKNMHKNCVTLADINVKILNIQNKSLYTEGILIDRGHNQKSHYTFTYDLVCIDNDFIIPPNKLCIVIDDNNIRKIYDYLQNDVTHNFIKLYSKNSHLNSTELLHVLPIFIQDDEKEDDYEEVVDDNNNEGVGDVLTCSMCWDDLSDCNIEFGEYCAHPSCSECLKEYRKNYNYNNLRCPVCRIRWNVKRRVGRPPKLNHF